MSVNVKCEFASLKYEQLLSDKYFIETCFSKKDKSYTFKQRLRDFWAIIQFKEKMIIIQHPTCPPEEIPCTTTTTTSVPCNCYTIFNERTEDGPSIALTYMDCNEVTQELIVDPQQTVFICAKQGTLSTSTLIVTNIGACSDDCSTTTTTTIG